MIAGESVEDATAAAVEAIVVVVVVVVDDGSSVSASTDGAADAAAVLAGDCDEDSVLELECCCGSGLVSDILRALLFEEMQFWFRRLCR